MLRMRLTVQVLVDSVQSDKEVAEDVLLLGGDVGEEGRDDGFARGEGSVNSDDYRRMESMTRDW
jgi:hypothetical protein